MYQSSMIELAGGKNAAEEITDTYWAEISYEQLLAWDPAYIILASDADYTVDDILNDENLKDCTAVKNGQVYQIPGDVEALDSPVPASILASVWLAGILHPEQIPADTYTTESNTYYETLFGTEIGENNEKAVEIIDLITSLTPEQLSDTNEIKHAFNTLSKELVKSGIDFVGIENQYGEIPSPKIIELLLHTKNILTNEAISEEGLQNYVNVYNEVFEKNQNTKKSLFDGIITNSMKIEKENISDASLFINNSLVKIKENVYKKVNRNYEDVYEAVYNLMKNGGKQVIPFDVSIEARISVPFT